MIRIITDSMSDLMQADAERLDITVLPLTVRFGDTEIHEGVDMSREEFYAKLRTVTELPKTSQIIPRTWQKAFDAVLKGTKDEVLCITGSSELSGGYQSALLARDACCDESRVVVLDSRTASIAQTMLVEHAVALRDAGAFLGEIAEKVTAMVQRQKMFGQADDLRFLVMGGRLSPVVGKVGNALSIKPMLKLENGGLDQAGLVRGAARARSWYVEQLKKYPPCMDAPLFVGGADCPAEVERTEASLQAAGVPLPPVRRMSVGPVIGTHVGPGMMIVCWMTA